MSARWNVVSESSRPPSMTRVWQLLSNPHLIDHLPSAVETLLQMLVASLPIEGVLLVGKMPSDPSSPRVFHAGTVAVPSSAAELFNLLRDLVSDRRDGGHEPVECSLPPQVQTALGTATALLMPIRYESTLVGLLVVIPRASEALTPKEREKVGLYGYILAHVFSDVQTTHDLRTLLAATRDLAETQDLETVLQRLLQHAIALTGTEAASILLQDTRTGKLTFKAAIGPRSAPLQEIEVPMHSIAGRALRERRPIVVADVSHSQEHFRQVDEVTGFRTRSLMAVPIHWQGETIGVLEVLNRREGMFDEHDLNMLEALASQAAALIRHAQLAAERERVLAELRRMDERKTQFMHVASHELRTPLTVIRGYVEMLSDMMEMAARSNMSVSAEEVEVVLQEIMNGTRRMEVIVDEITRAAELPLRRRQGVSLPVDLKQAVETAVGQLQSWAETKRLHLQVRLPETFPLVQGDPEGLHEAVLQVISNAVKFTPEGGRVEVALWREEDTAYLSVSDTGPGIPLEEQENIFQPFYQVEDPLTRQHPGLGLGLTIARQVVEEHGGRIWVESSPGKGSTFILVLPLAT